MEHLFQFSFLIMHIFKKIFLQNSEFVSYSISFCFSFKKSVYFVPPLSPNHVCKIDFTILFSLLSFSTHQVFLLSQNTIFLSPHTIIHSHSNDNERLANKCCSNPSDIFNYLYQFGLSIQASSTFFLWTLPRFALLSSTPFGVYQRIEYPEEYIQMISLLIRILPFTKIAYQCSSKYPVFHMYLPRHRLSYQSDFRRFRSTKTSLLKLIDDILQKTITDVS